jgi:hypothetical protein
MVPAGQLLPEALPSGLLGPVTLEIGKGVSNEGEPQMNAKGRE